MRDAKKIRNVLAPFRASNNIMSIAKTRHRDAQKYQKYKLQHLAVVKRVKVAHTRLPSVGFQS